MSSSLTETPRNSSPPRVVAVSGIIFSALYITSLLLVRLAVPADPKDPGIWLADPAYRNWVRIALNLVPFTGIAFLWFMAVLRNRIGLLEDRFFATVFWAAVCYSSPCRSQPWPFPGDCWKPSRLRANPPPTAKLMLSVGQWPTH